MEYPDPEQTIYNNAHRAFLQAFMSHATLTIDDAKPILASILSIQEGRPTLANDITSADFTDIITTINATLHPFDMEIRHTYPQNATARTLETRIYALVNLTSDPQTQLATSHSADEIAFVKRVLDGMFETNNTPHKEIMAIRGIDALNLARVARSRESEATPTTQGATAAAITKNQAETLLNTLVKEQWLEKSRAGYYSLSARSLIELRDWLVETYNEPVEDPQEDEEWQRIKFCNACREIVTLGQRCASQDCLCRFHEFCVRSFFRNQTEKTCPTCKVDWTGENYVGEKALGGRMSTSKGRPSGASTRTRRESTAMDDDSD